MDRLSLLFGLPYTDTVVVAGALVLGVTSGVLGSFAVLRGRSLVGDAIAHSTLPGVCVAFLVLGTKEVAGLLAGAAVAGLVAALLMVAVERSRLRPGLTGWAQVNGFRGETPTIDLMEKRVEYDVWYVSNWSIWLDLKIMARTASAVMFQEAY